MREFPLFTYAGSVPLSKPHVNEFAARCRKALINQILVHSCTRNGTSRQ